MKTLTSFADAPHDLRMKAREIVDSAGGMVAGYYSGGLQVALPADREACRNMADALRAIGIVGEDRITWFPLGSDNPPQSLRHHGIGTAACPYGDRPSYWKYRTFHVE